MRKWMQLAVAGALGLGVMTGAGLAQETTTPPAKKPTIRQRQKNQQKRIADGVEKGELSPAETAKIEKQESKLNREIRQDRKDGPGLTPKERRKINRQQNKVSREIYREKHDGDNAPPPKK